MRKKEEAEPAAKGRHGDQYRRPLDEVGVDRPAVTRGSKPVPVISAERLRRTASAATTKLRRLEPHEGPLSPVAGDEAFEWRCRCAAVEPIAEVAEAPCAAAIQESVPQDIQKSGSFKRVGTGTGDSDEESSAAGEPS